MAGSAKRNDDVFAVVGSIVCTFVRVRVCVCMRMCIRARAMVVVMVETRRATFHFDMIARVLAGARECGGPSSENFLHKEEWCMGECRAERVERSSSFRHRHRRVRCRSPARPTDNKQHGNISFRGAHAENLIVFSLG